MTDREQFVAERLTGVGGSDCASMFNVGYGCRRKLWYEKRQVPADDPFEGNELTKLGQYLEPYIRLRFHEVTKRRVKAGSALVRHPEVRQAIVHLDAVQGYGTYGVVEIKAVGRGSFFKLKREGMPEDYVLQVQHGMAVTNFSWGSFAVMSRDSGELLWWDFDADPAIGARILEEIPIFWAAVENGPAPDRLDIDDRRCQSCPWKLQCQGAAILEAQAASDGSVEVLPIGALIEEYRERAAIKKEAEALVNETKAAIEAAMGERQIAAAPGAKSIQFRAFTKKEYVVKEHVERPLRIFLSK